MSSDDAKMNQVEKDLADLTQEFTEAVRQDELKCQNGGEQDRNASAYVNEGTDNSLGSYSETEQGIETDTYGKYDDSTAEAAREYTSKSSDDQE